MKWIKPSGVEIETNDMPETLAYCRSLGWQAADKTETTESSADAPKRRGRKARTAE